MSKTQLQTGDLVIYRQRKFGRQPALHARNIAPSPNGDDYSFTVEKYWVVSEVRDDGTLVAMSRTGKLRVLAQNDPLLTRATWMQRLLYRSRFPGVDGSSKAAWLSNHVHMIFGAQQNARIDKYGRCNRMFVCHSIL